MERPIRHRDNHSMPDSAASPKLPITALRFRFATDTPPRLPALAGSAWRGAFGRALKQSVCVIKGTTCPSCLLYRSCAYPYIFETPPLDADKMRRYTAVPHPYAVRIEGVVSASAYTVGLTLFGRAERYAPYVIHAVQRAGQSGMGRTRQPFHLKEVQQAGGSDLTEWSAIYRPGGALHLLPPVTPVIPGRPELVRLEIDTPLRLRRREHLVTPSTFRFSDLFGSLLRRLSMLSYFHTDTPLEADFARLVQAAEHIGARDTDLRWQDWTRYSSRQQTTMEMGGLVGSLMLDGSELADFWPYLWLGQWCHAGKATTMGLGRYRLISASLPRNNDVG